MKKLTSLMCLLLVFAMIAMSLVACGGSNETETESTSETESQTESQGDSQTESQTESQPGSQTESQTESVTNQEESRETRLEIETPKNVNICCIGDSITQGTGTLSAYRYYLYEMLYSAGCTFKFTGSEKSTDPRLPTAYSYHGGYGGAVIGPNDQQGARSTYDYLNTYLKSNGDADMALVMLGHNNYYHLIDVDNIEQVYKNFILQIFRIRPDIVLYCGTMVAQASGEAPDTYKGYGGSRGLNQKLKGIISDMIAANPEKFEGKLFFVDLYNDVKFDSAVDFNPGDGAHPNENGQAKLAKAWYDAIVEKVLEMNRVGDPNYNGGTRVNGIKMEETTLSIGVGEGKTVKANVTPSRAEIFTILWSSSDESIATVNSLGVVTGVGAGTCTITGKTLDGGYTAKCEVTVVQKETYNYKELFNDTFENNVTQGKWEGKTESYLYTDSAKLLLWFQARTLDLDTVKSLDCGDNFKITASVQITGNEGSSDANYVGIKYDKLQMKIMSAGTGVKLMYDGKEVASASLPYQANYNEYTLQYINGTASILRNGEILVEKAIDGDLADSAKVNLYSKEPNRCVQMNKLVVEAAK